MAKSLIITGLTLTVAGALTLAWRDIRGRAFEMAELNGPGRRRPAWIGFPLIAVGSLLQIIGVLID